MKLMLLIMMANLLLDISLPSYLVQFPDVVKDLPQMLMATETVGGFSENNDLIFLKLLGWDEPLGIPHNCRQQYLAVLLPNWS